MIIEEAMFLNLNNGNEIPHADQADKADFFKLHNRIYENPGT